MKVATTKTTSEQEPLASDAQEANEAIQRLESSSSGTDADEGLRSEAGHTALHASRTQSHAKVILPICKIACRMQSRRARSSRCENMRWFLVYFCCSIFKDRLICRDNISIISIDYVLRTKKPGGDVRPPFLHLFPHHPLEFVHETHGITCAFIAMLHSHYCCFAERFLTPLSERAERCFNFAQDEGHFRR